MSSNKRGASVTGYGLMVGLVAVVALGAISTTGGRVNDLFGKTGSTLESVANEASQALPNPSATALGSPVTQDDCNAQYQAGYTTSGIFNINPSGSSAFDAYCEMALDGGGWTHAMTINVDDGNISDYYNNIWSTSGTSGSFGNRFSNDYKGNASHDITSNAVLIVVRTATAADGDTGSELKGWRSWNFNSPRSLQDMFNAPLGDYAANSTGGCNSGYGGDGNLMTSGIKASGQCANHNGAEDTFTCHASNLYSNSGYGNCNTGDRFRLSSWYRWANNSNVGIGLSMDSQNSSYTAEAGTHLAIETYVNPQRYCTNGNTGCTTNYTSGGTTRLVPGNDHASQHLTIGESWRYEFYVK